MKVNLEKQGKNVVQLDVELEADKAMKAYEVTCRQLSRKVNIPGFRKGKAPRNIIEKTLGVDYIKREALEQLVPQLLGRAIQDEKLDVITEPEIDSYDFELGQPLTLQARFEVRPEVGLGEYKGLEVEVPQAVLPAEAMDRALARVAETKSSLKEISDRELAMGDTAVLDFECYVDGQLVDGGKAEGLVMEMKEGNFLEGFCEQLEGKTPGMRSEVKVKFPDNYRNQDLAGKDAVFHVDLKGIREKSVPKIDDELAKSVGQDSLADLKEAIQKRLEEEVEQENEGRKQRLVVDAALANAEVDIPESMIEREHELLVSQVKQMVEQNGQNFDEFKETDEFAKLKEMKRQEAEQRVRTSLVLGAIVRAEGITVDGGELLPYLEEMAANYNVPVERVSGNEEIKRQVMEEVLTQKVVEFLVGCCKANFVEEKEPAGHSHEDCSHEGHAHEECADAGDQKPEKKGKKTAKAGSSKASGAKEPAKSAKKKKKAD